MRGQNCSGWALSECDTVPNGSGSVDKNHKLTGRFPARTVLQAYEINSLKLCRRFPSDVVGRINPEEVHLVSTSFREEVARHNSVLKNTSESIFNRAVRQQTWKPGVLQIQHRVGVDHIAFAATVAGPDPEPIVFPSRGP